MTYIMPHDPNRKRNRERRTKGILTRWEWQYKGRTVIVVEMMSSGEPEITVKVPKFRVDEVSREVAAAWLSNLLPRLHHEDSYRVLWG